MENILASITMVDSMITKFNIQNSRKLLSENKADIKIQFSVGLPTEIKVKKDINNFEIGLRVNLIVKDSENSQQITNIDSEIKGEFSIKSKDKEQILTMLKYNGIPILYQEIRAYITSVTALSHNKEVRLPMINFVKFFDGQNNL